MGIIPHEEAEEAYRRGYQHIRIACDVAPDGGLTNPHVQVRTGFNPHTGHETWEYISTLPISTDGQTVTPFPSQDAS